MTTEPCDRHNPCLREHGPSPAAPAPAPEHVPVWSGDECERHRPCARAHDLEPVLVADPVTVSGHPYALTLPS